MTEKRRKWLTAVGYPLFFITCFIFSLYLTFPMQVVRGRILDEMTRQLNTGRNPGPYGKPGKVTAEQVDLYHVSGVSFRNMVITPVTTNPDPAVPFEVDQLSVRLQLLPLLLKRFVFSFDVDAYEGHASGKVSMSPDFREVKEITASGDGFQWGKIGAVRDKIKVPGEGTLGGSIDLDMGKDIKEAAGNILLNGEGLALGPGELAVPGFGSLTLPRIDLGKLSGDIKVAEGKTSGPPMTLTGKDIQGQLEMPLQLRKPPDASVVNNGVLVFKLAEDFLKANPRFQPVFDFTPQLKQAKDEDGSFRFRLRGTLGTLSPRPDKTAKVSNNNAPAPGGR